MTRIAILLFILITHSIVIQAQQTVLLRGTVIDNQTGSALSYAQVIIQNKQITTITNERGEFSLPLNEVLLTDYLTITYVGYDSHSCSISAFLNQKDNTIKLLPKSILLKEVTISANKSDLIEFINNMVRVYRKNKRATPHIAKGYYREKAKYDGRYVMYTESIGYVIFSGNKAPGNNYLFFGENTRKSDSKPNWTKFSVVGMDGTSLSDVAPNSAGALNEVISVENFGLLSDKNWQSFSFHLDSTYYINRDKRYGISFTKGLIKGSIQALADSYQVVNIQYFSKPVYSVRSKKRVIGDEDIRFIYVGKTPFIDQASYHFKDENLEYWNEYHLLIQKTDNFTCNHNEYWPLLWFGVIPFVDYQPESWDLYDIPQDRDYPVIAEQLSTSSKTLEEQFAGHSGKWWLSDYLNLAPDKNIKSFMGNMDLAREYINRLKRFF